MPTEEAVEALGQPTVNAEPETQGLLQMPLAEFIYSGQSISETAELVREDIRQQNEFIRECMAEYGFVNFPLDDPEQFEDRALDRTPLRPLEEDGTYGIVPSELSIDWIIVNEFEPIAKQAREIQAADQAPLSPAAQDELLVRFEECRGEVPATIGSGPNLTAPALQAIGQLSERVASAPEIVQAWTAWSRCMQQSGIDAENVNELTNELGAEWAQLSTRILSLRDGSDPGDLVVMVVTDPDEAISFIRANGVVDLASVDALRAKEVEIAAADSACRGDLEEVLIRTQTRLELDFLEANGELIRPNN